MKKHLLIVLALLTLVSLTYSQANKLVLMENYTSSTCPPCASNNPQLRAWINTNWNNGLVAISYHMNWPSPGNDPMYAYNPTQNTERRTYYGVNSIPYGKMEGNQTYIGSPFPFANMQNTFNAYRSGTSPLSVHVTDQRVSNGDSNVATVTVTNLSTLPAGSYYLKVFVIENFITNITPPATNGETEFHHVFRRALPTTTGTAISLAPGTYTFEFRYKIDPLWTNNEIYTLAFVQNDVDKLIMNTYRAGMTLTAIDPYSNEVPVNYSLEQNYPNPFNPTTNIKFNLPKNEHVTLKIYDMLGNEIKTLVEGNQQAGKYNITFDASGLSSGVYFYTLKTGSFAETKKMMLVK